MKTIKVNNMRGNKELIAIASIDNICEVSTNTCEILLSSKVKVEANHSLDDIIQAMKDAHKGIEPFVCVDLTKKY